MKIDFNQLLVDLDGEFIFDRAKTACPTCGSPEEEGEKWTLGRVCKKVLVNDLPGDDKKTDKKFDLWVLATKINKGGTVDLEAKEITMIKDRIPVAFAPLIVGPAFNMLEGKQEEIPDGASVQVN